LHKGEFCVDVSTFGEIQYNPVPREKCDSTFAKQCEDKTEEICDEVTEIVCEVVPYTECKMIMENTPYRSFKMVEKEYNKMVCKEGMKTVQHTKMMPECKNVTKQNCVTKWETDEEGNQVWAGNEACEPVTWRECQLVPRVVDFKVPKIECSADEVVTYEDCEDDTKEQMTTSMLCEVKHTTACEPKVSQKCATVTYQECQELPEETCESVDTQVPFQEKEHKKKCLLPDDGSLPAIAKKEPEAAAPEAAAAAASESLSASESQDQPTYQPQPATTPAPVQAIYGAPRGGRQQFRSNNNQQQQTTTFHRNNNQRHQQQRSGRQHQTFRGQISAPKFVQQPSFSSFSQRVGQQLNQQFRPARSSAQPAAARHHHHQQQGFQHQGQFVHHARRA